MSTTPHPQEQEVRDLLKKLTDAGATLQYFDDGGKDVEPTVDNITAVDAGMLGVETPGKALVVLYIVLGNDPGELVADYTACEFLDRILATCKQNRK